jgi:hypothetical protein
MGWGHDIGYEGQARDQKDKMELCMYLNSINLVLILLGQVTYSCILVSNLTCTCLHKFSNKCIIYAFVFFRYEQIQI